MDEETQAAALELAATLGPFIALGGERLVVAVSDGADGFTVASYSVPLEVRHTLLAVAPHNGAYPRPRRGEPGYSPVMDAGREEPPRWTS